MKKKVEQTFAYEIGYIYKYRYIMAIFIVNESQFKKLVETGSNSAAMDLDRYVQPVNHDTSSGNESIQDAIKEMIEKLNEINYMLDSGKKLPKEVETNLYSILDQLNNFYEQSKK